MYLHKKNAFLFITSYLFIKHLHIVFQNKLIVMTRIIYGTVHQNVQKICTARKEKKIKKRKEKDD